MQTVISFHNLTIEFNSKIILDNISGSISYGEKVGLVGNNGSGKTTLLRYLNTIKGQFKVAYVKQINHINKKDSTVFEYLSHLSEWWLAAGIYEEIFKDELILDTKLNDLSGGELTKLNISIALAQNPDLLLLDEPTNHLDVKSQKNLISFLKKFTGAILVAAHDISFLNSVVQKIWEIEGAHLNVYGGNYSDYKKQKDSRMEAMKRDFEAAKKELNKLKKAEEIDRQRSQKGEAKMRRNIKSNDRSVPMMTLKNYKNRAENLHSKTQNRIAKLQEQAQNRLTESKIKTKKKSYIDLQSEAKKGTIIDIKDKDLKIGERILIQDVNLKMSYGDRISIGGDNGSGKTMLVKELIFNNEKLNSNCKVLYLSQKYENIYYDQSVFENITSTGLGYEESRRLLGNFLFITEEDLKKNASDLSGGEQARLAMAKLLSSSVDLLILDEPTNNLDIETIDVLITALKDYHGALIVISHNLTFLESIAITKFYTIQNRNLV